METRAAAPRRLRFSLRALLAAVAVLAVAGSHIHTSWRLRESERQVRRLRGELGYLEIDDPSLVHAIAVPTIEPARWKWRLHVPAERRCRLNVAVGAITFRRMPEPTATCPLGAGESLVTVAIHRDEVGDWQLTIALPGRATHYGLTEADVRWLDDGAGYAATIAGRGRTRSYAADEAMLLLRLRDVAGNADRRAAPRGPGEGIIVWLSDADASPGSP